MSSCMQMPMETELMLSFHYHLVLDLQDASFSGNICAAIHNLMPFAILC